MSNHGGNSSFLPSNAPLHNMAMGWAGLRGQAADGSIHGHVPTEEGVHGSPKEDAVPATVCLDPKDRCLFILVVFFGTGSWEAHTPA